MYLFKIALFITCFFSVSIGIEAGDYLKSTANSYNHTTASTIHLVAKIGGPRDVVQTAIDIRVHQPTATDLTITVIKSNGEVLTTVLTDDLETIISTQDWESGNYTIETVDLAGDYQVFTVSKQ